LAKSPFLGPPARRRSKERADQKEHTTRIILMTLLQASHIRAIRQIRQMEKAIRFPI
jgi:hypothetical protein